MRYRKISSVLGLACLVVNMFTSGAWAEGVKIKELLANPKSYTLVLVTVEGIVRGSWVTPWDKSVRNDQRCVPSGAQYLPEQPKSGICEQVFKVADETGAIDVAFRGPLLRVNILADGDRVRIDATFVDMTSTLQDYPPPFGNASYLLIQSISKTGRDCGAC